MIVEWVNEWFDQTGHSLTHIYNLVIAKSPRLEYMCLQAFMTRWGLGTTSDITQAFKLFKQAAQQGDAIAQSETGTP